MQRKFLFTGLLLMALWGVVLIFIVPQENEIYADVEIACNAFYKFMKISENDFCESRGYGYQTTVKEHPFYEPFLRDVEMLTVIEDFVVFPRNGRKTLMMIYSVKSLERAIIYEEMPILAGLVCRVVENGEFELLGVNKFIISAGENGYPPMNSEVIKLAEGRYGFVYFDKIITCNPVRTVFTSIFIVAEQGDGLGLLLEPLTVSIQDIGDEDYVLQIEEAVRRSILNTLPETNFGLCQLVINVRGELNIYQFDGYEYRAGKPFTEACSEGEMRALE